MKDNADRTCISNGDSGRTIMTVERCCRPDNDIVRTAMPTECDIARMPAPAVDCRKIKSNFIINLSLPPGSTTEFRNRAVRPLKVRIMSEFLFGKAANMQWILLLLAGISEVTWAVSMKYADGFTKLFPTIVTVVFYVLSAIFLSTALKKIPLGTAYAMWTAFGIVGTALLGVLLFKEVLNIPQVICIVMIILGIIGLKVLG